MAKQAQAKTRRNHSQAVPSNHKKRTVEDQKDIRDARRALKEARQKGSIPWERVKREVGI